MSIKESDLPIAASLGSTDYLRVVTSGGESKQAPVNALPGNESSAITPNISVSTGALTSANIIKTGNVVQLRLAVSNTAAIAAGSNIFAGTLESQYCPKETSFGVGYFGSAAAVMQITPAGAITVRVIGARIAANGVVWLGGTFVV